MKSYKILLAAAVAMTVAATPARADWSSSVVKIMIDPGHGGSDPGAGRSGYRYEHDLVLDCSLAMRDWLRSHGAVNDNVRLTRETNTFVDLSPRRQMSINYDPWIFCSVHLNAFNGEAHGTETWYYWANRSPQLAQCVQNQLVSKLGTTPRGVKQNGWTVITGASYIPAILTEGLFVDNVSENNMINSRDKAGFANWVNGHLQGFYDFMTSSAEVSYNGNQGLSNPASDPWSNGNKPTENPGGTGGSDANPAYDANWESKAQVKKNVFAYNIHVDKTNMLWPKVSYQLNGKTAWVKIHAYINGKEVATVDGTTNQRNEVTVDLSNVRERGDVYFTIQARTAEPETGDKPTLIKDDIPPSWTNNWHARFFNATGVTVNNCTDSPTFGRIIVAESHSCNFTGFVSSTNDKHGRGAMLYAFTPQMQPIPNPDLKGTWGFNGARDWDDRANDQLGSWTKVRYSEDGRLFAATATSIEGKRGVYELTDNSPNGGSLNGYATRVLSTSYPVTGLDVIGKGNDLRLAAFGPHHMIYTAPAAPAQYHGWYSIDSYGTDDVPYLKIYWPNTKATQDINMGDKGMGHVDTQTLSVAFDPDGNGMMVGNARKSSYPANSSDARYPIFMHVGTNSAKTVPLSDWENVDGGAVAYNHDRTIFAASGSQGEICLWRVNGKTGGVGNYAWIGSFIPEVGSSTRDIAFDYANNIYVTGDNCRLDLRTGVYIGEHKEGMASFQLPESWGGKVETSTPAPTNERIVNFQPAGVVVNIKEVKWTGKNQQVADIYWDDIANNDGQQPTGYTVMLNGRVYGDNTQIWDHSWDSPYHVTLDMFDHNVDANDINNTIQVIPYYNGTAEKESNILRIGHTDYEPNGADAINTNVSMEGGANGQQPVTISWNAPANADVYGYRLYRTVDGKTEPVNCPGDKNGIFPADRLSYRMADAGIKPCKFRVDAMMNYRLKLQNSEISDFVVGKESSTITPETNKRSAPTITELVNYPGRNGVRLSWSREAAEKPAYYIVERDGVVIVDRADYTSTIDMLVPDGMHTWKVTAVYNDGTRLSSEPATLINPIKREMAYSQYGIEEVYNYPIVTAEQATAAGLNTSNAIIPKIDDKFINPDRLSDTIKTKGLRNFGMGESEWGAKGGLYRHGSYRNGYWYIAQLTDRDDVAGTTSNMPDGYINYNQNSGNKGGVFRFDANAPLNNRPLKLYDLDHVENQWVAADDGDGDWVNLVTRRKGGVKNNIFYGNTCNLKLAYFNIGSKTLGYHESSSNYINTEYTTYVDQPNPSGGGSANGQNVRVHYVSANGNIGNTGGYVFIAMCNKPGVLRQYWQSGFLQSEEYIELPSRLGPKRSNGLIASPENYAFPVTGRPKDFILQLRSHGYYYYNDDTKQYTQIMGKDESYTAGGITFTYNGEMFLLHPSSISSNNIGHFRIDMPQRPTDESPYTSADFTDLIPMVTFTQKDLTGIEAKNANSMWFGVEPAPEENCMYIYQYVPGFRLAKYRFYSYEKFPPAKPELNLSVCYDDAHTKITHFKVDGNWGRPTVVDQGQEKDYEFNERTDYTLKSYRYRLLDPNMNVLMSGENDARDQSGNKILKFPKEYFQNKDGVKHIDNKVYTLQVQPVYQNKQTERFVNGEWASVQNRVDYPADIDPLTVKYYQNSGSNKDLFRVDFNFDRANLANYPDPVDYFTIEMKDGAGNWVSVPKIRIFFDDKMWLQTDDNAKNPSDPYYAGLETSRNYLSDDHIPGTYKFGNRGEVTGDMTDKRPATRTSSDPVVAYTIMRSDPSQTEFRAVAHYAATNSYISKSPAKVATPKWGGTTDIADISADDNGVARVHPVPARTDLTVDSPEAINTIVVLSMSGAEVMHVEGNGEHSQTLNISHLPQGNYMLSVNGHAALRWIKL